MSNVELRMEITELPAWFNFGSSAADKVNDLDLVGLADGGFGPIFAADNAVVYLYRDALFGQVEMLQKPADIDVLRNGALLAVHNNLHKAIIPFREAFRNVRPEVSGWLIRSGPGAIATGFFFQNHHPVSRSGCHPS